MAIAVEGSTTILMILDTVGYQDATIHLVMKGSHQDATIHLVVEEAQRKGIINPVAWNDLCLGVLTKEFKNLFVDLRLWLIIIIIIKIVERFCWRQSWFCTTQWSENYTLGMVWYLHQGLTISCSQKRTTEVRVQTEVEIQVQFHSEGKVKIFAKAYYISTKKPYKASYCVEFMGKSSLSFPFQCSPAVFGFFLLSSCKWYLIDRAEKEEANIWSDLSPIVSDKDLEAPAWTP